MSTTVNNGLKGIVFIPFMISPMNTCKCITIQKSNHVQKQENDSGLYKKPVSLARPNKIKKVATDSKYH